MPYAGSIVGKKLVTHEDFPTKLYVFRSYADNIAKKRHNSELKTSTVAEVLLRETLLKHREIMNELHIFGIAFAYGLEGPVEGIDIFSARLRDGWEGNPMYDSWTFENEIYVPREKGTTCGAGVIILGKEEEWRSGAKDLDSFLNTWPNIGDLYDSDF